MDHHSSTLLALLAISRVACGQFFGTSLQGVSFNGSTTLCNKSTKDANSTGTYSWNPNVAQFSQNDQPDNDSGSTLPVSWLVTVDETSGSDNASVQWSLWYSTNGANYSFDTGLGYDVCAFAFETTTLNAVYRAQNDNGDCLTMLDSTCVSDIKSQANEYAYNAVIDPITLSVRENLTKNSVNEVCEDVRQKMLANFPSSCDVFFNDTVPLNISGGGLTGANYSYIYEQCGIDDSKNNDKYYNIATYTKYTLDNPEIAAEFYTGLNWLALPALLIFLPTANANAPSYGTETKANLQCLRATDISADSESVSPAPKPTPLHGNSLSGGDIAGIVIGVLAAVALVAGAAFFLLRRRRRRATQLQTFEPDEKAGGEVESPVLAGKDGEQSHVVEAEDTPVQELSPDTEVEKAGTESKPAELSGGNALAEKEGDVEVEVPPAEMLGDVPREKE